MRRSLLAVVLIAGLIALFYFSFSWKTPSKVAVSTGDANQIPQKVIMEGSLAQFSGGMMPGDRDCLARLAEAYRVSDCDDLCFRAFLENRDPDLAYFVEENWHKQYDVSKEPHSLMGRVYVGLASAGINIHHGEFKEDFSRAQRLFEDIVQNDPGNGYPQMLYALVLKRMGKRDEARATLQKAAAAISFTSYFADLNLRFQKVTIDDPRMHLKYSGIYGLAPFPELRALEELRSLDAGAFHELMKVITSIGPRAGADQMDLTWNAYEHQLARKFIGDTAPEEKDQIPTYQEILERESGASEGRTWEVAEKGCNPEDFQEELQERSETLKAIR